jgi:signal transduction histidine kinase
MDVTPPQGTGDDDRTTKSSTRESSNNTTIIIAIVVVLVVVSIIVGAVIVLLVIVCLKTRKRKQDSDKIHKLQSVVLETKEDEEKEVESYMTNLYDVIDKPPQNGMKTAVIGDTTMDAIYSNPNEAITDDTYDRLRDTQKNTIPSQKMKPEMMENEAYSINKRVEIKENEAYSVNKRLGGPEMEQNEAYGVAESRGYFIIILLWEDFT